MLKVTKDELVQILKNDLIEIHFVKANGENRKMIATLKETHLLPTKGTGRPEPQTCVRVVDTEINEWRSIPLDRIESYEIL